MTASVGDLAQLRDKLAETYLALGRPDVAREQWDFYNFAAIAPSVSLA